MNAITTEQLPLFLLLMLPGLVSRKVYDLQVPAMRDDAGRYMLDALFFGALNAGIWFYPAAWIITFDAPAHTLYPFIVSVLVISPVVLAVLTVRILRSHRLRGLIQHPTPMAWDYYFGLGRPCLVLCRLKSGKSIGGYFGPASFASSFPNPRDIYLQQIWRVDGDGRLKAPIPNSAGVLVSFDECEMLEFFETVSQPTPEVLHER